MSFQTQMRPDFIPPSVTSPVNLPAPANSPYQPLQPGNGQFSSQVAGTAPQQDIDLQLAQMSNDSYTLSGPDRSEEHTSELQSLMRISYAVFCLKKKKNNTVNTNSSEIQTRKIQII